MGNQIKHYIRLDENSNIIHRFSTAFEQPLESDICINEDTGRHFELLGEVNPSLKDENRILRFKYDNVPVIRTDEEKQPELDIINAEKLHNETLKELKNLDNSRETEELIDVLIAKGVIIETDLPTVVMNKIKLRKETRLQL